MSEPVDEVTGVPRAAVVTLVVLVVVLVAALVVTTPWRVLPDVPGGATPVDPAGDFTVAERAVAAAYQAAVVPAVVLGLLAGLVVSVLLGLTSWGARLVEAAGAVAGGGWVARAVLGTATLVLVGRVATLPFDVWAAGVRRDAGLLTQSWPAWAADQAKALVLVLPLVCGTVLFGVALARRWPDTWWVPAAAGAAGLVVALSFLFPVVVEPLFAQVTPMAAGPERDRLVALAERDGVPVSDVLVSDASRRGTTLNAYVSGFGATRRLVVFDTLLDQATPAQVDAVVAHELGHAEDGDVLAATLLGALAAACGVLVVAVACSWRPLLARAGADGPGDPRVAALALAVVAVLTTLAGPVQNLVSRHVEARADVHALDLTGDPLSYARLQRDLAVTNRSSLEPPLWRYLWFATHPTAPQRIAATRDWSAVNGRQPPGPLAPRVSESR